MALKPETQLQKIWDHLARLQGRRFYGTVEIHIQDGTIIRFQTTESVKLEPERYNDPKDKQ